MVCLVVSSSFFSYFFNADEFPRMMLSCDRICNPGYVPSDYDMFYFGGEVRHLEELYISRSCNKSVRFVNFGRPGGPKKRLWDTVLGASQVFVFVVRMDVFDHISVSWESEAISEIQQARLFFDRLSHYGQNCSVVILLTGFEAFDIKIQSSSLGLKSCFRDFPGPEKLRNLFLVSHTLIYI